MLEPATILHSEVPVVYNANKKPKKGDDLYIVSVRVERKIRDGVPSVRAALRRRKYVGSRKSDGGLELYRFDVGYYEISELRSNCYPTHEAARAGIIERIDAIISACNELKAQINDPCGVI
jgi:hypothetical protein